MDQIHHGLGLTEIHPAVEEGALAEFTGLGRPAATREQVLENFLGDEGIAVARNFHRVLTGEGIRRGEERE